MIIGVNGFKGQGKDTIGAYLVEKHGYIRASFAAKLKASAAALFGIDSALWDDWKNAEDAFVTVYKGGDIWGPNQIPEMQVSLTVRQFLQNYGTEAHRDIFGSDFWVDEALKGIDINKNYVFTDARFDNELKKIIDLGGYNIRVFGRTEPEEDGHASEVEPSPDLIDFVVENNGTVEELYEILDQIVDEIKLVEIDNEYTLR